jgi:hypothetical protein
MNVQPAAQFKFWGSARARRELMCAGALCLALGTLCGCAHAPRESEWITLFDGNHPGSLNNWGRVGEDNWRIENGTVMADSRSGTDSTYLVSRNVYSDVEIYAEVWVTSDTNSGIFFRCSDPRHISAKNCYEMNIWDTYKVQYYATGAIALFAKVDPVPKAGGKWSTFDITARGKHFLVKMDGKKTVELDDDTYASGPIALQYGGGIVKWRKVKIKLLSTSSAP